MSISITQDKAEERKHALPSKDELLNSIRPDMRLTKDFFRRVYGYEISYPGFAERAIALLETAGCIKAGNYYEAWVNEFEATYEEGMKEVSAWYAEQCKRQWDKIQKEGEAVRARQPEVEQLKTDLQRKSDRELLILLQRLKQSDA